MQLGAFDVATSVQPAQVPAKNVYECLCAKVTLILTFTLIPQP